MTEPKSATKRHERRSSGALGQEHMSSGGFLLEFEERSWTDPMFGSSESPLTAIPLMDRKSSEFNKRRQRWRSIERKSFLVTKEGCMIPHPQYGIREGGANGHAYQTATAFFTGYDGPTSKERVFNHLGWDSTLECSHLCHRNSCCNPTHIVVEPFWRNRKRNFCGFHGSCDCGNSPKCLRRYQSSNTTDNPELCTTRDEVLEALKDLKEKHPFKVLHASAYAKRGVEAQKRANRQKRKRAGEKQALKAAKKAAKEAFLKHMDPSKPDPSQSSDDVSQ